MSLFGALLGDVEDDPFFGSHMRHMRQMNNMMNSLFSDPFGMFGVGGDNQMALMGHGHGGAMMPFMPNMAPLNRLFSVDMDGGMGGLSMMGGMAGMGGMGSSYSSSTVVMSSGPSGKPQVFSSSSSTKIGPNGVKETRKTLEDSRTGTKKMSIGHHIGERAHVVARAQNLYSGEREEEQQFINIEEDDAEDFDREFQEKSGGFASHRAQLAAPRSAPLLALAAPDAPTNEHSSSRASRHSSGRVAKPSARRPLRASASPLATSTSASVREIYGGSHPQRHRHRQHRPRAHAASAAPPSPPSPLTITPVEDDE